MDRTQVYLVGYMEKSASFEDIKKSIMDAGGSVKDWWNKSLSDQDRQDIISGVVGTAAGGGIGGALGGWKGAGLGAVAGGATGVGGSRLASVIKDALKAKKEGKIRPLTEEEKKKKDVGIKYGVGFLILGVILLLILFLLR